MVPSDSLCVSYEITCRAGTRPEALAIGIAYEQTVELPDDCLSDRERDRVVGRVVDLEALGESSWLARISYTVDLIGGSFVQLLNLIYGNISLDPDVRVVAIDWPRSLCESMPGPRFGIAGMREQCNVPDWRPLTCGVAKPVGLSVAELAGRCRELALGGVDLIKDDHSLGDQPWAPFFERVGRCQAAIAEANAATDGRTVYLPTLGVSGEELDKRVDFLRDIGCQGATVLPIYQGFDTIRDLAGRSGLILLGHPSGSGAYFQSTGGITADVLFGQIYRLAGCDVVNFPRAGGRFPISEAMEARIVQRLREPLGAVRPAAPAPGGSVDLEVIEPWLDRFGADTVFVIGAGFLRGGSIRDRARRLADALEQL